MHCDSVRRRELAAVRDEEKAISAQEKVDTSTHREKYKIISTVAVLRSQPFARKSKE